MQIDCMEAVLQQFPRAGFVIAGSGSQEAQIRANLATKPYAGQILLYLDADRLHGGGATAISARRFRNRRIRQPGSADPRQPRDQAVRRSNPALRRYRSIAWRRCYSNFRAPVS